MWIESPLERGPAGSGSEDAQDGNGAEGQKKGSWLNRAFDTHPPLDERIRVLKEM
jgi:Zn-dependent protease with chaperone function